MKIEMAWPGAGLGGGETVRNELPALHVNAIDHHFVNAEVRREGVLPRRVGHYAMRVRSVLPLRVGAFARVLRHVARFAEAAPTANWIDYDAAPSVVGRHNESPGGMNRDVTGHAGRMTLA